MEHQLVITADGSHSLYLASINEHYHSINGAIQESRHVFIEAGLKEALKNTSIVNILEVGLGTGLNAFLTFLHTAQSSSPAVIHYTAIEPYPLEYKIIKSLNYISLLNAEAHSGIMRQIHQAPFDSQLELSKKFSFIKEREPIQEVLFTAKADLIYFDAFGPPVQPEMWHESIFKKLHTHMNAGGILVTYCAKGAVKRALKQVGFIVESLPGPPGKREMVRARKS